MAETIWLIASSTWILVYKASKLNEQNLCVLKRLLQTSTSKSAAELTSSRPWSAATTFAMTQRSLKKLHNMILEDDYDAAIEAGVQAATDLKIAINAIKPMKEKQHALREQT